MDLHETQALLSVGLLLLGIVLLALFLFWKHRNSSTLMDHETLCLLQQQQREKMTQEIGQLDEEFARGRLNARAYCVQRTRVKHQLVEIIRMCTPKE